MYSVNFLQRFINFLLVFETVDLYKIIYLLLFRDQVRDPGLLTEEVPVAFGNLIDREILVRNQRPVGEILPVLKCIQGEAAIASLEIQVVLEPRKTKLQPIVEIEGQMVILQHGMDAYQGVIMIDIKIYRMDLRHS